MVIAHLYVLNIPGKNTGILSKAPTKSINDPMIVRSIETRHSVAFLTEYNRYWTCDSHGAETRGDHALLSLFTLGRITKLSLNVNKVKSNHSWLFYWIDWHTRDLWTVGSEREIGALQRNYREDGSHFHITWISSPVWQHIQIHTQTISLYSVQTCLKYIMCENMLSGSRFFTAWAQLGSSQRCVNVHGWGSEKCHDQY